MIKSEMYCFFLRHTVYTPFRTVQHRCSAPIRVFFCDLVCYINFISSSSSCVQHQYMYCVKYITAGKC